MAVVFLFLVVAVVAYFAVTILMVTTRMPADDLASSWQNMISFDVPNNKWPFQTATQVRIYFVREPDGG